jgi:hypothetical protein
MPSATLLINRAPVLTLWAAVVAERLGYDADAAATFGKTVAGLNAATKAIRLGIAEARPKDPAKRKRLPGHKVELELLGRAFAAIETPEGLRAIANDRPIDPATVQRYLESKFGEDLKAARDAMKALAKSRPPKQLAEEAFALYEAFRPEIPRGTRGWGAKGVLDLAKVRALAKEGLTHGE